MIDLPFLGGGQINLLSIARSINRNKFEVSVCSSGGGPLINELRKSEIPHIPVKIRKGLSWKTLRSIAEVLRAHRFDIVHTHGGVAGSYGRWAARISRTPVVIHTIHGIHYLHYRNPVQKKVYIWIERFLSHISDAVIFVSDADRNRAEYHKLASPNKMVVVKNGLDFSHAPGRGEARTSKEKEKDRQKRLHPVVGTVARLHRQKGIPYLLKAARIITRAFPETSFRIIGGGPWRDKLVRMSKSLGLEGKVQFLGEKSNVSDFMKNFDVFVLPSLWEGLPYALIEAGLFQKPVVATDIDGNREVIQDGTSGHLVPPKDPEALAQAVIQFLNDRAGADRMGRTLEKNVVRMFSLQRMINEIETLYEKLFEESTQKKFFES